MKIAVFIVIVTCPQSTSVCSFKNAETSRKLRALKDVLESIEQTEYSIKEKNQECESKIHAEQERQKEVCNLLQQISKLQNDLKGSMKESGKINSFLK
jgi:chromosome segregation ATPase